MDVNRKDKKMNANETIKDSKIQLTGLNHLALNVTNMDKSEHFYSEILGFPVINRTTTRDGFQHIEVDAGNVAIALFESPDLKMEAAQKVMTEDGYLHFAFGATSDRFPGIVQTLKDHGVKLDGELRIRGGGYAVYFFDPDGHILEIHVED